MPIKGQQNKNSSLETAKTEKDAKPTETGLREQEKPRTSPSREAQEKTHAETRAGLNLMQQTIEEEKKEKQERHEFLKKECEKRRNPESWTGKAPEEGLGSSVAKKIINVGVEEKFEAYIDQFRENGLGDQTNINAIKQAAKEIIYSHYLKTGNDKATTTEYIKSGLGAKLKYLLNGLKEINGVTKYGFKKPIDCLQAFSDFTGLNFISNGFTQPENLKKALLLEKSDYEFFLKSFQQSLNINLELTDLSGRETNAAAQKPEKMDIAKMLKEGKIKLKSEVRITLIANEAENLARIRKNIYDLLPDNTDPKARDMIASHLTDEVKGFGAKEGETVMISANGEIGKIDLAAEQTAKAKTKQSVEEQVKKAETVETGGQFDKFITALLAILQKLMASFGAIAAKAGISGIAEFAGLNEAETREAVEFKKMAEKSELNIETLAPLLKNAGEMKKVLKNKKEKGLDWEDYFTKYLSTAESDEFKKKQNLEADKIAESFLSPAEEIPAPDKPGTPNPTATA